MTQHVNAEQSTELDSEREALAEMLRSGIRVIEELIEQPQSTISIGRAARWCFMAQCLVDDGTTESAANDRSPPGSDRKH